MYLDHAATTPIRPQALDALVDAHREAGGNASGSHAVARAAKNLLEDARERAASLLGAARPDEIVFTSGGTESDALAIAGASDTVEGGTIVTSAIEHKAVLEAVERFAQDDRLATVRPGTDGVVAPDAVDAVVDDATSLVSVMAANNEVGSIQPIGDITERVGMLAPEAVVHTDAVQAFVGASLDVGDLGVDLLTLAAHKFGGPKGVGLLYVRSGVVVEPMILGGGQEAGRRSGTSNVPGVAAMVAAMEAADAERDRFTGVVGRERDSFEEMLGAQLPDVVVTGAGADRLPHFSHVRFPGVPAESLLIRLDQAGIQASAGSSCQSGAVEPSHVLAAMGFSPTEAGECVRFTFGWTTVPGEGALAAAAVAQVVRSIAGGPR